MQCHRLLRLERLESRQLLSITPLGSEIGLNTHDLGAQYNYSQSRPPTVAMDAEGNSVAVWISENQDGHESGIFAQRFDSTGNPLGNEFQVNSQA